ncbi:MAG: hypothetical protein LJE69_09215 [Thiohalocapsa sp.]|jgi:hypothetical protein|uniref:hypothetical protein n=1 Tax=Thiohalocapsa sp. TaxID=2497641 RepID=UPI0025DD60D6|nr:hypothetical protein [Thiohalocapsa sp.]MCG6941418.1 hypothetical protein [Thiohalocapsa sp.]
MAKLSTIVAREVRKALPAVIFFLVLFHLIALTKAVSLADYQFTALRTAGATLAALIVAKAILVAEALPLTRRLPGSLALQVLWKTLLYSAVVLAFRVVEELIPLAIRHGGVWAGAKAMGDEVAWPFFAVIALWIIAGLFLYTLISELVHAVGPERVRALLFARGESGPG